MTDYQGERKMKVGQGKELRKLMKKFDRKRTDFNVKTE